MNNALIAAMKLMVSRNNARRVISCIMYQIPPNPVPIAMISAKVLLKMVFTRICRGIAKSFGSCRCVVFGANGTCFT